MSSIAMMLGVPLWDDHIAMTHVMIYIYIQIYMKYGRCHVVYPYFSTLNDDTSIYPQFCWDIMGIRQLSIYPIPSHPIQSYLSIHLSIWTCIYCTTNNMWWECLNMGYRVWDNSFDSEKYDKRTWILGYPMFRQTHFTTHFFLTGSMRFCSKWVWVTSQFPLETSGLAPALFKN